MENVRAGSVVVGVDGSPTSDAALVWAADQAVREHRPLAVVHAYQSQGQHVLDAAVDHVGWQHRDLEVQAVLHQGDPRQVLLDVAQHAAVLVLGSRGRGGIVSMLLGSTSLTVVRQAPCPVVVVRPGVAEKGNGVLVGIDGSARSRTTLEYAYRQASLYRSPLTVLFAPSEPAMIGYVETLAGHPDLEPDRLLVSEVAAGLSEQYPDVVVRVEIARGRPSECLIGLSQSMDLVVVGRPDPTLLDSLGIAAQATLVVEHAGCPVAVVPQGTT